MAMELCFSRSYFFIIGVIANIALLVVGNALA